MAEKSEHQSSLLLSIIVVSYNTCDITLECLKSVIRSLAANSELANQVEIIVVDNASTDDSVHTIKQYLAEQNIRHSVLGNIVNLGFAGANNQGILAAKGQYSMLLNSDALVGKTTLTTVLTQLEQTTNTSLIACSLWNTDGSYQPQGGDLPGFFSLFSFALLLDDIPLVGKLLPSIQHTGRRAGTLRRPLTKKGWVAGTALCFPTAVITEIGVLDEAIFMYAEDVDFCWRAKKKGITSYISKDAKVVHLGSASSSSAKARIGEFSSLAYVCRKQLSTRKAAIAVALLRLAARVRKQLYRMSGNQELAQVYTEILELQALR